MLMQLRSGARAAALPAMFVITLIGTTAAAQAKPTSLTHHPALDQQWSGLPTASFPSNLKPAAQSTDSRSGRSRLKGSRVATRWR
jgi:hypothetical protein